MELIQNLLSKSIFQPQKKQELENAVTLWCKKGIKLLIHMVIYQHGILEK